MKQGRQNIVPPSKFKLLIQSHFPSIQRTTVYRSIMLCWCCIVFVFNFQFLGALCLWVSVVYEMSFEHYESYILVEFFLSVKLNFEMRKMWANGKSAWKKRTGTKYFHPMNPPLSIVRVFIVLFIAFVRKRRIIQSRRC